MTMQERGGRGAYAIRLDLGEGQLIFEALAELPFKHVYELIGKLNSRANEIAAKGRAAAERHVYMLDEKELKLVASALGAMPFNRVHDLLASLNEQARAQAEGPAPDEDPAAYGRA